MARPGDLYGPPIREASVRGGSGRFNWDDVKKDEKFRDTYIGHSLKAPVGRWQKGKDLDWYAKPRPLPTADEARTARLEELRRVKEAEEEALAEALGFKVERKRVVGEGEGVTKEELESVLKEEEGRGEEVEGTKGLGFGSGGLRVGARLPDGSVVQEQGVMEGDVKVKVEEVEEKEGSERERRKHRHRHRRRDDEEEEERSRRKHRHHRRDEERRPRSRSPHSRQERESDKERHSDRRRDSEREERRDGSRWRDHRERDHSPRRDYRERRDRERERERSPHDKDRRHRRRDYIPERRD
jgi:hypothetical protein